MLNVTLIFGGLCIVLGIASYLGTGARSPTALIPAFIGVLLVALGAAAHRPTLRKHAMHAAAALAALGCLAAVGRLAMAVSRGTAKAGSAAPLAIFAVLTAVYVALCVRSFIQARRQRGPAGFDPVMPPRE